MPRRGDAACKGGAKVKVINGERKWQVWRGRSDHEINPLHYKSFKQSKHTEWQKIGNKSSRPPTSSAGDQLLYDVQVVAIHHTGRRQVAPRHSGNLCRRRSARHLPDSTFLCAASPVDNFCGNGHQ